MSPNVYFGAKCITHFGVKCTTHFGVKCTTHFGVKCTTHFGVKCTTCFGVKCTTCFGVKCTTCFGVKCTTCFGAKCTTHFGAKCTTPPATSSFIKPSSYLAHGNRVQELGVESWVKFAVGVIKITPNTNKKWATLFQEQPSRFLIQQ
jgi:hypothetical protein